MSAGDPSPSPTKSSSTSRRTGKSAGATLGRRNQAGDFVRFRAMTAMSAIGLPVSGYPVRRMLFQPGRQTVLLAVTQVDACVNVLSGLFQHPLRGSDLMFGKELLYIVTSAGITGVTGCSNNGCAARHRDFLFHVRPVRFDPGPGKVLVVRITEYRCNREGSVLAAGLFGNSHLKHALHQWIPAEVR